MRNGKIIGSGIHVPEKIFTNDDLSRMLGEDINEFVSQNLGILERHVLADDESAADLASAAAENALKDAGISAAEIDLIVVSTDTPEYLSPATSVVVQHRIGAVNAGTFDTNCRLRRIRDGFRRGFEIHYRRFAITKTCSSSAFTRCRNFSTGRKRKPRRFSPTARARSLLQATEEETSGWLASKLEARGEYHDFLGIFAGGSKYAD